MPVAIVTGGSRGIGRAISVLLAESGFDVAINFLNNRKAAEETARKVEERRQTAGVFQANISSKEHGVNLVDTESVRDTLIDLHNYSAMAIMLFDEKKKHKPHFYHLVHFFCLLGSGKNTCCFSTNASIR